MMLTTEELMRTTTRLTDMREFGRTIKLTAGLLCFGMLVGCGSTKSAQKTGSTESVEEIPEEEEIPDRV